MTRFRRLPLQVEAVHWNGENWQDVVKTFGDQTDVMLDVSSHRLIVNTAEGQKACRSGDWVLKDPQGSFDVLGDTEFVIGHEADV